MHFLKQLPIILSVILLSLCVYLKQTEHPVVKKLQFIVFDTYQTLQPRPYTPQPVKIIDIDETSLAKLGQWPWPRSTMAKLVDKLTQANTAAIGFDIAFVERDRTSPSQTIPLWGQDEAFANIINTLPDHDELFAEAIARSNVVTSYTLVPHKTPSITSIKASTVIRSSSGSSANDFINRYEGTIHSLPLFEDAAAGNGYINGSPDEDGVIRKMPLFYKIKDQQGFFPSLIGEVLRIAQGASSYVMFLDGEVGEGYQLGSSNQGITSVRIGEAQVPTNQDASYWIYYTGYRAERYIPAWKILEDDFDASKLAGNIVFVGTSAIGLKDIRATPLNKSANGVEVHAQALEQILSGTYLTRAAYVSWAELAFMTIAGLAMIFIVYRFSALWGALLTLSFLLFASASSWYSFSLYQILLDPISPTLTILAIYLTCSIAKHISAEKEKREVRKAFSQYMSPALVEKLAQNPDQLQLGGETKELSIMFCDIRGFTSISEQFNANDLTRFLNRFLTPMTNIILNTQGTIDKYMGDCIMAFWNAPLDDENHAKNSCLATLEMFRELKALNATLEEEAIAENRPFIPINIGAGINTGMVCVGNMGSEQRFDYSVIGDDVNLAARLEGQSKTYGVDIILGQNTHKHLSGFATLELDKIQVKGKKEAVTIYALLGEESLAADTEFVQLKKMLTLALNHYRKQEWHEATAHILPCKDLATRLSLELTPLLELYTQRIEAYKATPPAKDWSGVFVATSK